MQFLTKKTTKVTKKEGRKTRTSAFDLRYNKVVINDTTRRTFTFSAKGMEIINGNEVSVAVAVDNNSIFLVTVTENAPAAIWLKRSKRSDKKSVKVLSTEVYEKMCNLGLIGENEDRVDFTLVKQDTEVEGAIAVFKVCAKGETSTIEDSEVEEEDSDELEEVVEEEDNY